MALWLHVGYSWREGGNAIHLSYLEEEHALIGRCLLGDLQKEICCGPDISIIHPIVHIHILHSPPQPLSKVASGGGAICMSSGTGSQPFLS